MVRRALILFVLLLPVQAADCSLSHAIEAALSFSEKETPFIHKPALNAWKNFKKGSPQPHYTYRYWARNLIIWMKKHKNITFDSEQKVAEVFKYLHDNRHISDDAVFVLTRDVWSYLLHLEGVPDWDKRVPGRGKSGGGTKEAEA